MEVFTRRWYQTMYARYQDIQQADLAGELDGALPHFVYWLMNKVGLIEIEIGTHAVNERHDIRLREGEMTGHILLRIQRDTMGLEIIVLLMIKHLRTFLPRVNVAMNLTRVLQQVHVVVETNHHLEFLVMHSYRLTDLALLHIQYKIPTTAD